MHIRKAGEWDGGGKKEDICNNLNNKVKKKEVQRSQRSRNCDCSLKPDWEISGYMRQWEILMKFKYQ